MRSLPRTLTTLSVLAGFVLATVGSTGVAGAATKSPTCTSLTAKYASLANHTYVVAIDPTNKPYEYRDPSDPSKITGFDPSMASAALGCLGFKHTIRAISFDGLIPAVQSGQADIQWSSQYYKPERAKAVDYVVYARDTNATFAKAGLKAKRVADLCGKSVAVGVGTVMIDTINATNKKTCNGASAGPIDLMTFQDQAGVVQAVLSGRADAGMFNTVGVDAVVKQHSQLRRIFELPGGLQYGVSIRKKQDKLLRGLRDALKWVQASGRQRQLMRHFGLDTSLAVDAAIHRK